MDDLIKRQDAVYALWKALYDYENKTEKQFLESEELNVDDWFSHRIFVQNMSDVDRQTIIDLPPAQPEQAVKDCRNCKHGKYNDYHGTYFCYNAEDCSNWDKWETSEQQWIPCSEKLPEVGQEVLRTIKFYDRPFVDIGLYDTNDGRILAWMPLPEPWKERE